MYKSLLLGSTLTLSVTAMVIMAPNSARQAFAGSAQTVAEDSVFMDEGDGEFAAPQPATGAKAAPAPTAKAAGKPASKVAAKASDKKRKPASADEETPLANAGGMDDLEAPPAPSAAAESPAAPAPDFADQAPADTSSEVAAPSAPAEAPAEPVAPVKETKKPKAGKKAPKVAVHHANDGEAHGKSMFVNTKEACPMLREPAADGEKMLTVKAAKKIWVEEVDSSWVRAFNKAGEPGYVNRDCLE